MGITYGKIQRTALKNNVYQMLKDAIQFLDLKPGSVINDAELAGKLGISRTPIREAFIRLSDELLVDIYPQKGTYVAKIDLSLIKEMEYMRHILETEICIRMCKRKSDIKDIVSESLLIMSRTVEKQDVVGFIVSDSAFHRAIFSYDNHEMIWDIISNNRVHYIRFLMLDMAFPNILEESYQEHKLIVDLIGSGDVEGLIRVFNTHHDYNNIKREKQIKKLYSKYLA